MTFNPLPLLAGIKTYLIVGTVMAAVAFTGGAYAGHRWEHSKLLALQLQDAQALASAVQAAADSQRRQDQVDLRTSTAEAYAQGALAAKATVIRQEVPFYVTPHQDAVVCVPVGLVRVLDAAVLQTNPGAIQLAPGQSDDACSDVKASVLADAVVAWLSTAHANAEQLNALEAWIAENHKAQ